MRSPKTQAGFQLTPCLRMTTMRLLFTLLLPPKCWIAGMFLHAWLCHTWVSPERAFVTLKHWGRGHGSAHVNSTHPIRTSLNPHTIQWCLIHSEDWVPLSLISSKTFSSHRKENSLSNHFPFLLSTLDPKKHKSGPPDSHLSLSLLPFSSSLSLFLMGV